MSGQCGETQAGTHATALIQQTVVKLTSSAEPSVQMLRWTVASKAAAWIIPKIVESS